MHYRYSFWMWCSLALAAVGLMAGCSGSGPAAVTATVASSTTAEGSATSVPSATVTERPTATGTQTRTVLPSRTASITPTASVTPTLTITPTVTITATPTRDFPDVMVKMQANCRYGPGTAYLYRWGLYPGDKAEVHGRNWNGSWWWILPENLPESHCWASEIVFNETVVPESVPLVQVPLPHTTFAGPPGNVTAERRGNQVTVSWSEVPLSDDKRRGYLIESMVCQDGAFFPLIVQTDAPEYTFRDDDTCEGESGGLLYTAEKHGYSDPVQIPWPK